MADGLLKSRVASGELEGWEIYSAGVATHGINPYAQKVMAEIDIDISEYTSNHVEEYDHLDFDLMLTVCDHAKETCPWFPSDAKLVHHSFEDPADAKGEEEEVLPVYRRVRDEIGEYLKDFVKAEMLTISPSA